VLWTRAHNRQVWTYLAIWFRWPNKNRQPSEVARTAKIFHLKTKKTADFAQKRVLPTTIVKVPSYRLTAEFSNMPPDWSVHFHRKIWSKSGGFLTRLTRFSRHNMTRFSPELSEGRFGAWLDQNPKFYHGPPLPFG
jgi:hypothetical protein